jgi:uncharacterized RDD family membrane protein YckC
MEWTNDYQRARQELGIPENYDVMAIIAIGRISSFVFFSYWTYFESTTGQSIGKKVMNLKTTNLNGTIAEGKRVALAAFGKAFLLPFDVFLGWIFTNEKRQRIFNRASNTIVIKIKTESRSTDGNVRYIKD